MEYFLEIIKVVLPACITGLVTFLVTRFNYRKNMPLDKLEIAYNRIYYPIYCLIRNTEDISQIVEKSEVYLKKYNKFVDRSTMASFNYLHTHRGEKKALLNFKNNVNDFNYSLRRRLGYLEPGIFTMYKYASPFEKRSLRFIFELLFMYLAAMVFSMLEFEIVRNICVIILIVSILAFILEIIVIIICFISDILSRVKRRIGSLRNN